MIDWLIDSAHYNRRYWRHQWNNGKSRAVEQRHYCECKIRSRSYFGCAGSLLPTSDEFELCISVCHYDTRKLNDRSEGLGYGHTQTTGTFFMKFLPSSSTFPPFIYICFPTYVYYCVVHGNLINLICYMSYPNMEGVMASSGTDWDFLMWPLKLIGFSCTISTIVDWFVM